MILLFEKVVRLNENQADALFLRKYCQPDVHKLLQSFENPSNFHMRTGAGIEQDEILAIPAMNLLENEE